MHIIKKWRVTHHIKICEMADIVGISQPSLTNIEREYNRISGDTALIVSQLTGIDVFTLRPDLKVDDARIGKLFRLTSDRKNGVGKSVK